MAVSGLDISATSSGGFPSRPGVYAVTKGGLTKIGYADDLKRRLAQLDQPTLLHWHTSPIAAWLERALHRRLSPKRAHGEWYHLTPDDMTGLPALIAEVEQSAPQLAEHYRVGRPRVSLSEQRRKARERQRRRRGKAAT